MCKLRLCHILSLSTLVIGSATTLAQDAAEVMSRLKSFDSIYASGYTVSGTRKSKDVLVRGKVMVDSTRQWRLTLEGERVGYVIEMVDYETPKYRPPDREAPGGDKVMRIPIRTRQWGYWGKDLSGNHYEDTILAIDPNDECKEQGKMHNSSLFGPRDIGPNAPKRAILWSQGRFFSRYLEKINTVGKSSSGLVVVSAKGHMGDGDSGRWELEIDPKAAWMVRRARFFSNLKPDIIGCEMRNSGTVWSGVYCIPEKAQFNYWGPIEDGQSTVEELTFNPIVEEFDEEMYADTERAVAKNKTPKLTIHDYRVSPPRVFQPNELHPTLESALEELLHEAMSDISENTTPGTSAPSQTPAKAERSPETTGVEAQVPRQGRWWLLSKECAIVLLVVSTLGAALTLVVLLKGRRHGGSRRP